MPKSPQKPEKPIFRPRKTSQYVRDRAPKRAHVYFARLLLGEVLGEREIGKKKQPPQRQSCHHP
jgi:hypothetical protein